MFGEKGAPHKLGNCKIKENQVGEAMLERMGIGSNTGKDEYNHKLKRNVGKEANQCGISQNKVEIGEQDVKKENNKSGGIKD